MKKIRGQDVAWIVVVLALIGMGIVLVFSGVPLVATAAVIGGFGSAIGGLAAAYAAMQSRASAQLSSEVAARMDTIAKDSRLALGRAMSPQLDCAMMVWPAKGYIWVTNSGAWPAEDVTVQIDVAGRPTYRRILGKLGTERPDRRRELNDIGPLPADYQERRRQGAVKHRVVLTYRDRDRILEHRREYEHETRFAVDTHEPVEEMTCVLVAESESPAP